VWTVRFRFSHQSGLIDQRERYFVVRLDSDDVDDANRETLERSEIQQHRWWSCGELQNAAGNFRPRDLAALLPDIIAGDYPAVPIVTSLERSARLA
jgi:hypothetical protein